MKLLSTFLAVGEDQSLKDVGENVTKDGEYKDVNIDVKVNRLTAGSNVTISDLPTCLTRRASLSNDWSRLKLKMNYENAQKVPETPSKNTISQVNDLVHKAENGTHAIRRSAFHDEQSQSLDQAEFCSGGYLSGLNCGDKIRSLSSKCTAMKENDIKNGYSAPPNGGREASLGVESNKRNLGCAPYIIVGFDAPRTSLNIRTSNSTTATSSLNFNLTPSETSESPKKNSNGQTTPSTVEMPNCEAEVPVPIANFELQGNVGKSCRDLETLIKHQQDYIQLTDNQNRYKHGQQNQSRQEQGQQQQKQDSRKQSIGTKQVNRQKDRQEIQKSKVSSGNQPDQKKQSGKEHRRGQENQEQDAQFGHGTRPGKGTLPAQVNRPKQSDLPGLTKVREKEISSRLSGQLIDQVDSTKQHCWRNFGSAITNQCLPTLDSSWSFTPEDYSNNALFLAQTKELSYYKKEYSNSAHLEKRQLRHFYNYQRNDVLRMKK